jgi:hypothetical protein
VVTRSVTDGQMVVVMVTDDQIMVAMDTYLWLSWMPINVWFLWIPIVVAMDTGDLFCDDI